MKITNCYNCGSDKHTFYAEENGFTLIKCEVCGLLFVESRPEEKEISEAYKQGKHAGKKELDVTGRFNKFKIDRYGKKLKDLFNGDLANKSTWLDVGCGHGEFMLAVQKFSHGQIIVRGTEPNIHKQASARKRGLDVSFFELETHKEKYDVISLLNVYSHIPDPPSFLKSLKNLLKPGGELILETGDTADLLLKDHPQPFLLPGHLSFASESIVTAILKRVGFEIINIKKYPYIDRDLKSIAIELVKAVLPKFNSKFWYILKGNIPNSNMYIRARIKS